MLAPWRSSICGRGILLCDVRKVEGEDVLKVEGEDVLKVEGEAPRRMK
jgi:hypothetical protein